MDLPVVPLHQHPKYKMQCCRLINAEWKRSDTARLRSLESSSDQLPTCLILIDNEKVIGHVKLSPIPSIKDGCFIESVVIEKTLRGMGYGTYLMRKSEEYCKTVLNLKLIYLSTKGQEIFYAKLGYNVCQPISIYGGFISKDTLQIKPLYQKVNSVQSDLHSIINNNNNRKTYMCKEL